VNYTVKQNKQMTQMTETKDKTKKADKPKKLPLIDKIQKYRIENIESIEDLPEKVQIKVINSVLESPVIPMSFARLKEALGDRIKILKDGEEIDFDKLSDTEKNGEQGFTPKFFINLVLNNPKYLTAMISQININSILAKAYQSYVLSPDDPFYDEFRSTCELRHSDIVNIRKLKKQQEKDAESSTKEPVIT